MIRVSRITITTIKPVDAVKIQILTRHNCDHKHSLRRPRDIIRFKEFWVEPKGLKSSYIINLGVWISFSVHTPSQYFISLKWLGHRLNPPIFCCWSQSHRSTLPHWLKCDIPALTWKRLCFCSRFPLHLSIHAFCLM